MNKNNFYTIGHLEVPQRKILDKPLYYFEMNNDEGIKKKFKQLKELTNYQYDNTHLKWSNIYGKLFSISVHLSNNKWNIHVWDSTGTTTVLNLTQEVENKEKDNLSKENYQILSETTKRFVGGKILCSDCNTEISKDDVAGTYFTGSYCKECWESKWKEIEAKETYC